MTNLETTSLLGILPPNLRSDPNISAAAKAIDVELQAITISIRKLSYFDRLDELTDEETDELAWQFHVDFYDPSLPLEQRRELVKNSFAWHRRKGTPSAIEELIATLFGDGRVEEWWQFGGDPYTFRVITSNASVTTDLAQEFIAALNSVKNIRSHLESVIIEASESMDLYFGNVLNMTDNLTIKQVV